jgi:hypothetical protein
VLHNVGELDVLLQQPPQQQPSQQKHETRGGVAAGDSAAQRAELLARLRTRQGSDEPVHVVAAAGGAALVQALQDGSHFVCAPFMLEMDAALAEVRQCFSEVRQCRRPRTRMWCKGMLCWADCARAACSAWVICEGAGQRRFEHRPRSQARLPHLSVTVLPGCRRRHRHRRACVRACAEPSDREGGGALRPRGAACAAQPPPHSAQQRGGLGSHARSAVREMRC